MIARLIQMHAQADTFDTVVAAVRERVVPAVRQLPGYERDTFAGDPATGRLVSFVVFRDQAGVDAAEDLFARLRGTMEALSLHFESVENLEVLVSA